MTSFFPLQTDQLFVFEKKNTVLDDLGHVNIR